MSQHEVREHSPASGYSSKVQLQLTTSDGNIHRLAQIGPDFVMLRQPAQLPAGNAEILMRVDDYEKRWAVLLSEDAVAVAPDLMIATTDL